MNNSNKGKASTNQDRFPSYSPPLRENFTPSITKTEEAVSEEEMTYGKRREEEPIGGNRQDFQYHRIELPLLNGGCRVELASMARETQPCFSWEEFKKWVVETFLTRR